MALACGSDSPGPPPAETCPTAQVPLCDPANAATVSATRDAVSDAAERLTPALDNATARTALASRLAQLGASLAAGNVTDARDALRRGRDAIAVARGQLTTFPGDAAGLTFVELALDQVAPLLGSS